MALADVAKDELTDAYKHASVWRSPRSPEAEKLPFAGTFQMPRKGVAAEEPPYHFLKELFMRSATKLI